MAVLFVPHATAVFIVVVVVAVLEALWPVTKGAPTSSGRNTRPKFTVLLLPFIAPIDCTWLMLCVVEDAAALAATPALAETAAAVGVTTTGFQTGFQTGIALTAQHCVTTQHATVGQQLVVGHAQLQHVEVVQLVH
jgi:hypothetical protein